ncbi:tRNA (adenosine(37)-N6)-threonylcarbamoyltransferase complex ATPase subunit type 1 TsaE [Tenacibaculum sp. SG-28]|uniref:tRNA (adenosine(37)-N6)-threonylcarbamoyltransferase complex ATPase subunit type 1 TsaE n=1 Tax=Tenacibaculum sp. SG-28 TaxID=754426 RepID=UPI000CF55510|nr:tRNA (adenosine(37)-N6)-threonylcarbamoyltransferase complex ATPase subunit type 1 TsaE [Tenacibaculum sp. SG-28]PQJ23317.1 tRNA (adenosine(37)-N6)-threonylcarbamoyltransferase complex ATPase subunit type 1 TsaE [Tenacibaculum sp. SG-28]
MNKNYSLELLSDIAKEIIQESESKILLFYGEMGAGKTTLVKEICKVLNCIDTASSPTFSLVNEYKTTDNESVYHFDFYRIEDEEEALDIGIEDYLYSDNWCLIEWPDNVKNLLPLGATRLEISILDSSTRNIQLNQIHS